MRDIQPEELAPIVNLVNELENGSGGHDSQYGRLGDITWKADPRDDYLYVNIKFHGWTFWNGEQLQNLMDRVNRFAEEHDNKRNNRIYYLSEDREVNVSLELPFEPEEADSDV